MANSFIQFPYILRLVTFYFPMVTLKARTKDISEVLKHSKSVDSQTAVHGGTRCWSHTQAPPLVSSPDSGTYRLQRLAGPAMWTPFWEPGIQSVFRACYKCRFLDCAPPDLLNMTWDPVIHVFQRRQWHPTPVPLPRKSRRRRSLVGCGPWSH